MPVKSKEETQRENRRRAVARNEQRNGPYRKARARTEADERLGPVAGTETMPLPHGFTAVLHVRARAEASDRGREEVA